MKTKALLSTIIVLMLSAGIYASEPIILKNEKTTEFGKQVEQTIYMEGSDNILDKKVVSNFDHEGQLMEKTTYKWTKFEGWIPTNKLVYNYSFANELAMVSYATWNENADKWITKSETKHYNTVADSSVLFATKVIKE